MRKRLFLSTLFISLIALHGCKKDNIQIKFDDVMDKPYTTGIIKLQYQVTSTLNGYPLLIDTVVSFTSTGNNPAEQDDYGYSQPSIPWVQLQRLNPNEFQNRAMIFFVGTDLNSLTLPYKFKPDPSKTAQI